MSVNGHADRTRGRRAAGADGHGAARPDGGPKCGLSECELGMPGACGPSHPGALDLGPRDQLRQLPDLVRTTGLRRLPTVLRGLIRLEGAHPEIAHRTLLTLGVDPAQQGRGRAGAMLRALAARGAEPLYLETSSPGNVRLYERHGYVVRDELRLAGGLPAWTMLALSAGGGT